MDVQKLKPYPNGSINLYKARIVAKGFNQEIGMDYQETFSLVVKPNYHSCCIDIGFSRRWSIRQLNIKKAFLHGDLCAQVYMTEPSAFVNPKFPSYDCKL